MEPHKEIVAAEPVKSLLPLGHKIINFRSPLWRNNYYDHPDGEDLIGKLVATNRWALYGGIMYGVFDVTMGQGRPEKGGYQARIGRIGYWTLPLLGCATAFTTVVYASTRLRQKDDIWNYTLGALAAGGVVGAWQNRAFYGWGYGFAFVIAAWVKRTSMEEGWPILPDLIPKREHHGIHSIHQDISLFEERPKGYDVVYSATLEGKK